MKSWRELVQRVRETGRYAIDVETDSLDPLTADLVGIAIAGRSGRGVLHPGRPREPVKPDQLSHRRSAPRCSHC